MRRYRLGAADCARFDEVPDGEWVRWEDHEKEVQAQRKIGYARGDYDGWRRRWRGCSDVIKMKRKTNDPS